MDFPDEDLPERSRTEAAPTIARIAAELDAALADGGRGERVRDGYRVALIGAPNAGKSSLLNALADRDAAIVTATPGTTRDVIEVALNLAGYRVRAGGHGGHAGVRGPDRGRGRSARAGLGRGGRSAAVGGGWRGGGRGLARGGRPCPAGRPCLLNKSDLPDGTAVAARAWAEDRGLTPLDLSLATGQGLDAVKQALSDAVVAALSGRGLPGGDAARHRRDLAEARAHLGRALRALAQPVEAELAAEDVRLAARSLARISGAVGAEDVLDRVFARFCIGK